MKNVIMNRTRVAALLRILFHAVPTERKLDTIFGAGVIDEGLFPIEAIWDLIFEELHHAPEDEAFDCLVYEAWNNFKCRFVDVQEFDPAEFLDWLVRVQLERSEELSDAPLVSVPRGVWAEKSRQVIQLECIQCGHEWSAEIFICWEPYDHTPPERCRKCEAGFIVDPSITLSRRSGNLVPKTPKR